MDSNEEGGLSHVHQFDDLTFWDARCLRCGTWYMEIYFGFEPELCPGEIKGSGE